MELTQSVDMLFNGLSGCIFLIAKDSKSDGRKLPLI